MFETLTCTNYKAHIGPYTWHLGGVSILQNSNGKSSLLRLLPLLRGPHLFGQGPGFQFDPALTCGPLVTAGTSTMSLGFTDDSGIWSWDFDRNATLVAAHLNGEELDLKNLAGLLPFNREEGYKTAQALLGVRLLTARRVGPSADGSQLGAYPVMQSDGRGAEAFLVNDSNLFERVRAAFFELCFGPLTLVDLGHGLRRIDLYGLPFEAAGAAAQHAFPIFVAAELLRRDGGVLCIENPEIALNHKRQRALAAYLMRLPVHNHGAQLILETSAPGFIEVATEMQLHQVR